MSHKTMWHSCYHTCSNWYENCLTSAPILTSGPILMSGPILTSGSIHFLVFPNPACHGRLNSRPLATLVSRKQWPVVCPLRSACLVWLSRAIGRHRQHLIDLRRTKSWGQTTISHSISLFFPHNKSKNFKRGWLPMLCTTK